MVKGMLTVRRIVGLFAFALAFLGWVAAFVTMRSNNDLEYRLSSTEAELSETRSALDQASNEIAVLWQQDTSGRLEKVRKDLSVLKDLSDSIARLKGLSLQIDEAEALLAQLRTEVTEQQTLLTSAPEKLAAMPSQPPSNDLACLQGGFVRIIRVKFSGLAGEPPCSVVYEKSPPEEPSIETLWRSHSEKGFCEAQAGELVEKLRGWNWTCGPIGDVLGVPE